MENKEHFDAIIVLGGGLHLPPHVQERLKKALEIRGNSETPLIVCGGKTAPQKFPGVSEAQEMKDYLCSLGVKDADVWMEDQSRSTFSSAYCTKIRVLEPNHWQHVAIVTTDYHIKRAHYTFQKILGRMYRCTPISVSSLHFLSKKEQKVQAKLFLLTKIVCFFLPRGRNRISSFFITMISSFPYTKKL